MPGPCRFCATRAFPNRRIQLDCDRVARLTEPPRTLLRRARQLLLSPRCVVVCAYAAAALACAWPLPLHLGTALLGDPGGDTGVYIWNQWVFQHEAVARQNPLTTDQILSLIERVDLSQHNYTAFLNLLALPLLPWFGSVATFNIVLLLTSVLTALTTYALVRRVTHATRFEAWLAGAAFAWSPVLVARSTGHLSLAAAAPLAAFLLCLVNADRSRRPRDAALTGLCMAWAGFCDVYYAVYCLIILLGYLGSRLVRVTLAETPARAPWRWTLNVLIFCVAGLIVSLLLGRGGRFDLFGINVSISGLYTPVLTLTVLVLIRVAIQLRPHVWLPIHWSPAAVKALAVGVLACAGPLAPVLYGLSTRFVDGRFVVPPTLWRSSPRGVDLLALVEPNPSNPLVRWFSDRQIAEPSVFVEYTAALSLVALGVVAVAVWKASFRPRAGWVWMTVGFATMALGPFVFIAGANTFVPGPWSLLRYVPIVGAARTPTRFAVVATLGLAVLLAGALASLGRRYPERRRQLGAAVAVLLLLELYPGPRPLYSAEIPPIYDIIAADPRPVRVLELPFGVRDGVSSAGNFSARYLFFQTHHGKRLVGGYLSRISAKSLDAVRAQPTLDALLTMSEGDVLTPERAAQVRERGPRFIERSNIGWVVINTPWTPPHLTDFVIDAWDLVEVARDGALVLYRPTVSEPATDLSAPGPS